MSIARSHSPEPTTVPPRTAYAVWELTLQCNLGCTHCGSRAGTRRDDELSTDEALDLVRQLKDAGITEVTLEGGEAFLRRDWLTIARAISDAGMACTMVTGGYGISRETAWRMREAGIVGVSVSVDGLEPTHDRIRGRRGSFRSCFHTFAHFQSAGLVYGANTQINRASAPELPQLYPLLRDAGIGAWQVQLTTPMGNGAERTSLIMQPAELHDLYRTLARIGMRVADEGRVQLLPGSNIGYFGPYDAYLYASIGGRRWLGCIAGLAAVGIHADGAIKGCPTLPSEYVGGNVRTQPLDDILESRALTFNVDAGTPEGTRHLRGFCARCPHRAVCRGGCTQTATVLMGERGDNPYCHHRAYALRQRGLRERIVPRLLAKRKPFDHGAFRVIEEPLDAPWPAADPDHFTEAKVVWPAGWERWTLPDDDALARLRSA